MAVPYNVQLAVYEPNGPKIATLPDVLSCSPTSPWNDTGSLQFTYPKHGRNVELLSGFFEIAVEIDHGSGYVEPDNMRFISMGRNDEGTEQSGEISFDLPGYSWLLKRARLNNYTGLSASGTRVFLTSTAGHIMGTLINECQTRMVLPGLTFTFNGTTTSTGGSWPITQSVEYNVGQDLWTILNELADQGLCDWTTRGRQLVMVAADATSVDHDHIVLRYGVDLVEGPNSRDATNLSHRITVGGDGTAHVTVDQVGTTPDPWGTFEDYMAGEAVTDTVILAAAGTVALKAGAKVSEQLTRTMQLEDSIYSPLRDFDVGDWITVPGSNGALQRQRIREIAVLKDSNGVVASLILADRFLHSLVKQLRRDKKAADDATKKDRKIGSKIDDIIAKIGPTTPIPPGGPVPPTIDDRIDGLIDDYNGLDDRLSFLEDCCAEVNARIDALEGLITFGSGDVYTFENGSLDSGGAYPGTALWNIPSGWSDAATIVFDGIGAGGPGGDSWTVYWGRGGDHPDDEPLTIPYGGGGGGAGGAGRYRLNMGDARAFFAEPADDHGAGQIRVGVGGQAGPGGLGGPGTGFYFGGFLAIAQNGSAGAFVEQFDGFSGLGGDLAVDFDYAGGGDPSHIDGAPLVETWDSGIGADRPAGGSSGGGINGAGGPSRYPTMIVGAPGTGYFDTAARTELDGDGVITTDAANGHAGFDSFTDTVTFGGGGAGGGGSNCVNVAPVILFPAGILYPFLPGGDGGDGGLYGGGGGGGGASAAHFAIFQPDIAFSKGGRGGNGILRIHIHEPAPSIPPADETPDVPQSDTVRDALDFNTANALQFKSSPGDFVGVQPGSTLGRYPATSGEGDYAVPSGAANSAPTVDRAGNHTGSPGTGTPIENMTFYGVVRLGSLANVWFKNCHFKGTLAIGAQISCVEATGLNLRGAMFTDCTFEVRNNNTWHTNIRGSNYSQFSCELFGGADGYSLNAADGNVRLYGCYAHDGAYDEWTAGNPSYPSQGSNYLHCDGVQIGQGANYYAKGCYFGGPRPGVYSHHTGNKLGILANGDFYNSAVLIAQAPGGHLITGSMERCVFEGGTATVNVATSNGYDLSGFTFRDCVWPYKAGGGGQYYILRPTNCAAVFINPRHPDGVAVPIVTG